MPTENNREIEREKTFCRYKDKQTFITNRQWQCRNIMRQHGQWKNGKCFGNVKLIHVRFNSLRLWAQRTHTHTHTNASTPMPRLMDDRKLEKMSVIYQIFTVTSTKENIARTRKMRLTVWTCAVGVFRYSICCPIRVTFVCCPFDLVPVPFSFRLAEQGCRCPCRTVSHFHQHQYHGRRRRRH